MSQLEALGDLFSRLAAMRFYGEVLVKLESGRVVVVKKTESIKLPEERGSEHDTVQGL